MATVKISQDTDRARRGLPPKSRQRVQYDTKGRLTGDKASAKQHKTEVHHANRRASVVPIARNSPSGRRARANLSANYDIPRPEKTSRSNKPRVGNLGKFAFNPKAPTGYQHVLMVEMIIAFAVIGLRAIADYAPADDLRSPGTETPKKGANPVTLIASTLAVYFVLAFMASRGGWPARVSAAFGMLMIIALLINSQAELTQVAGWIENIGPNANSQQTSQSSGSSGSTSTGGAKPAPQVASPTQLAG